MEERQALHAAAWAAAAVLVVLAAVKLLSAQPDPPPVKVERGGAEGGAPRAPERRIFVHVAGAVRRPGLYRLRDGLRVAAAVARAGGPAPRADLAAVNLAAPLADGQQVVVPRSGGAGGRNGPVAGGTISLGSATAEELEQLDGIGPTLAERIVEHRQARGGLRAVDDLAGVEGIGEKRLEALSESLSP